MDSIMAVGSILRDTKSGSIYRIVSMSDAETILCEMYVNTFSLSTFDTQSLIQLYLDKEIVKESEDEEIFDINKLPEKAQKDYRKKKSLVSEVINAYGYRLMSLNGKQSKPELREILDKYETPKNTFWRVFTKYMQSGMKDYSLIDTRYLGFNKGKEYTFITKPGRNSEYFVSTGILTNEEVKAHFDEAIKEYRSGRAKTLKSCYERMNLLHYTRTEIINGIPTMTLLPESERPTIKQFYYYVGKTLTKQEKDAIKTSLQEQRNDKRLITSDSLFEVYGPGDMVEIDACEADVSLVSSFDPNRTIGRPIVYFMIDVYTRIILAVSVALDNNSVLGVTNLFLNLADDKQEYCHRFGMGFDNPAIWPSNIIPRRLRDDRGSEFKSKEYGRICIELGIEKQIVPGATGSLKGIVEQSFHQMHSKQNPILEDYGLIEKRYDSNHHKEATLNIEQYTKMVINFVLTHNQEYDSTYPVTKDMIENGIKAIPCLLWEYGIKKYGSPRPIPVRNQYLYNLMIPVKAKLDRRGITYKNLYYLPDNDKALLREMFNAGVKKVPFEARMDMRDVGHIYYLRDGKLIDAPLNERLTGNADFKGLTMKQYEDYLKKKRQMDAEGRIHNQELSAFNHAVNAAVVDEAKKDTFSNPKEMRSAREIEKQTVSHKGSIASRISSPDIIPEKKPDAISDKTVTRNEGKDYESFEEALADFMENN